MRGQRIPFVEVSVLVFCLIGRRWLLSLSREENRREASFFAMWVSKQTCNSWQSLVEALFRFVRMVLGETVETCRRWWSWCDQSRKRGKSMYMLTELRSEDIRRHFKILAPYSAPPLLKPFLSGVRLLNFDLDEIPPRSAFFVSSAQFCHWIHCYQCTSMQCNFVSMGLFEVGLQSQWGWGEWGVPLDYSTPIMCWRGPRGVKNH